MAFTTFANQKILNAFGQAAAFGSPATHNFGLLTAAVWLGTHVYSLGAYTIPTTFASISGEQGKIFKCTTAGTSAASEPAWPTGEGATVVDGTVTWTEVSLLFAAGTFTGAEIAGNGYARVALAANSTNFPAASSAEPSLLQNGVSITFPNPTAGWGLAVGWIDSDALTVGNIWQWGAMTSALDCPTASTPLFGVSALSMSLSALLTA